MTEAVLFACVKNNEAREKEALAFQFGTRLLIEGGILSEDAINRHIIEHFEGDICPSGRPASAVAGKAVFSRFASIQGRMNPVQ